MDGSLNWLTDPIVCVLVGTLNYTLSKAHASLADIPVAARIAVSGTLTGRTVVDGVADANDVSFGTTYGNPVNAVVLCSSTGTDLSSYLIAYLDQSVAGLPLNPDGSPITLVWSSGSNKIFAL